MSKLGVLGILVAGLLLGAVLGAGVIYLLRDDIFGESTAECPGGNVATECPVPVVTVDSGVLRGTCRAANKHKGIPEYAAFLGIPYVKPPLGELRFKSPRPVEPWRGVRNADAFGPRCTQGLVYEQQGAEDCLHVNVYSPWLQRQQRQQQRQRARPGAAAPLLPVLVHVHGGAMKEGTGVIIRPDYFIAQDLVVVTFNYRLGHFGFLNLDSDLAPGNAGFKDIVAAFQWVNRNIHHFGGDPAQVTVQGCSSAAAAVHWMTLIPDTEGLFRAAIIKSGSALLSWAFTEHHREQSDRAAAFIRTWRPNSTLEESLHHSNTLELEIAFTYADEHRPKTTPPLATKPTVSLERRAGGTEPRMILKDAEAYMLQPARTRIPLIMGLNACEYDMYANMFYVEGALPGTDVDLPASLVPRSGIPTTFAQAALGIDPAAFGHTYGDLADDIRTVAFNLTAVDPSCDLLCRWQHYITDVYIKIDTARAIRMHAREDKQPVYAYLYEFPMNGHCPYHAEDDKKLWPEREIDVFALNTTDPRALNIFRQVVLFSNFAKFGEPVPKTDPVVLPSEWTPMLKDGPDVFLRFGTNLTLQEGDLVGKFGAFWESTYAKYRDGKGI